MHLEMDATILVNRLDYVACSQLVSDLKVRMASFHRDTPLNTEEMQSARESTSVIPAIKLYRERTGVSLVQAKHAIEAYKQIDANEKYRKDITANIVANVSEDLRGVIQTLAHRYAV